MANMSYCRFRNTLKDLRDCEEAMNHGEDSDLDKEEERAKKRLIRLCVEIARDFGPTKVSNALFAMSSDELKVH